MVSPSGLRQIIGASWRAASDQSDPSQIEAIKVATHGCSRNRDGLSRGGSAKCLILSAAAQAMVPRVYWIADAPITMIFGIQMSFLNLSPSTIFSNRLISLCRSTTAVSSDRQPCIRSTSDRICGSFCPELPVAPRETNQPVLCEQLPRVCGYGRPRPPGQCHQRGDARCSLLSQDA